MNLTPQSNHCPCCEWHFSLRSSQSSQPRSASFEPTSGPSERSGARQRSLPSRFVGRLDVLGSSVFISRPVTAARWSVSSPGARRDRRAGVTQTDRRCTGGGGLPQINSSASRGTPRRHLFFSCADDCFNKPFSALPDVASAACKGRSPCETFLLAFACLKNGKSFRGAALELYVL